MKGLSRRWRRVVIVIALCLFPAVTEAVDISWGMANMGASPVNLIDGFPVRQNDVGLFETALVSQPKSHEFRQILSRGGAYTENVAAFKYQIQPNGSGSASINVQSSAQSHSTKATAYLPGGASLSFEFELTEQATIRFRAASRLKPSIGNAYGGNSAGTLMPPVGSWVTFTDDAPMYVGVYSASGYPMNDAYPLAPGRYSLGLGVLGTFATADAGSLLARAQYSVVWSFDEVFPGTTPQTPIKSKRPNIPIKGGDDEDEESVDSDIPISVTGSFLTFPAIEGIGHTGDAFVGLSTMVNGGASDGAWVTGYEVVSEYSALTSFVVPDLPVGAENLTIDFGAGPQSVIAGQTIDLGPEGVSSFTLAGFDPLFSNAELDAFVMGIRVAEEGLASLIATPTVFIPDGDFNENGVVDAADYTVWRDGFEAGTYTQEDYVTWAANYGAPGTPPGSATSSDLHGTIPEPSAALLCALAAGAAVLLRRNSA